MLAIERDWRMRRLIRANLEPLGFRVQEAVSEQHGLQRIREARPDLILLSLELPDEDALRLLRTLRSQIQGTTVPVVVISAEPPSRQLLQEGDVAGYLLIPFAVPALLKQIKAALDA